MLVILYAILLVLVLGGVPAELMSRIVNGS
jgi:hypothetical protein